MSDEPKRKLEYKYCKNCDEWNSVTNSFCSECGHDKFYRWDGKKQINLWS